MSQTLRALALTAAAALALTGCGSSGTPAHKPAQASSASPSVPAGLVPFKTDGISIDLPGKPHKRVQTVPIPGGKVKFTMYLVGDGKNRAYLVGVSHYPGNQPLSLDGAVRSMAGKLQGKLGPIQTISRDGHPGRAATLSAGPPNHPLTVFMRDVQVGRSVYQLVYMTGRKKLTSPGKKFQQVWSSAHFG